MRQKFNILLLFLLMHIVAFSQNDFREGYIVNEQGDTLKGLLALNKKGRYTSCIFKEPGKGKVTRFKPSAVLGYGYKNGNEYKSTSWDGEGSKFTQILITGKASLYRLGREFVLVKDSIVVLEEKPVIVKTGTTTIKTLKYKSDLKTILSDCDTTIFYSNAKYSVADITKIIMYYNACLGVRQTIHSRESNNWKPKFYVAAGYGRNSVKVLGLDELKGYTYTFKPNGLEVMLGMTLSSSAMSAKWLLMTELKFSYLASNILKVNDKIESHAKQSILTIPIGLKHSFSRPASTLTFGGGLLFRTYMTNELYTIGLGNKSLYPDKRYDFKASEFPNSGLWYSIGYSTVNYRNKKTFFDLRFENFFKTDQVAKGSGWGLSVGRTL